MDLIKRESFLHGRVWPMVALAVLLGLDIMYDGAVTWAHPLYVFLVAYIVSKNFWLSLILAIVALGIIFTVVYYRASYVASGLLDYDDLPLEYTLDDQLPPSNGHIDTQDPTVQAVIDAYQDQKEQELDDQVYINAGHPISLIPDGSRGISFTDARLIGEALEGARSLIPMDLPFIEGDKPVKCVAPFDASVKTYAAPDQI